LELARGERCTPTTVEEILSVLPEDVLDAIARAHGIEPRHLRDRRGLVATLASLPDAEGLIAEADRRRIAYRLAKLRTRQLRELGDRHKVSLHGLRRKSELVEALAAAPDSSAILLELEAGSPAERDAGLLLGRESGVDFDRVEGLLNQARRRFQERRFEAALTAAQEASRIAERTTEQLRRASWSYAVLAAQGLLEPCDPADSETIEARSLLAKARDAFFHGSVVDDPLLRDLVRTAESAHRREAERVREALALTRDAIREASNLGAPVAFAEDAWNRGADFLDRDRLAAARESFVEAAQRAEDARRRRLREVEESVGSVHDLIELARNVGSDVKEAEALHERAKAAIAVREHGAAGDLLSRAERLAMKGQQQQIERAIQLREAQVEKAQAILGTVEPILKEAESYELNPTEVRTLLRQAQDVLAKGDYLGGVTLARNAEEAARRLDGQIAEERARRGLVKPTSGVCGVCKSPRVTFQDDGWGRCGDCGTSFRWRGAIGVWERLRQLLPP
jgi:hypothetical protein